MAGSRTRPAKQDADAVRRKILDELRDGRMRPGQRLGSERALAERFAVSRSTLRLALDALERSGMISRVPGRAGGTFLRQSKIERDLSRVASVPEYLARQGYLSGTKVISASIRPADEVVARELELTVGAPVCDILRVRLANAEPISLEHATLPAEAFPDLLEQPLGGSLSAVLREVYDVEAAHAIERIEVVSASRDEARLLGVEIGAPVLSVERTTASTAGKPYEFSVDLFRSDRTRMVIRTTGSARELSHVDDGKAVEIRSG